MDAEFEALRQKELAKPLTWFTHDTGAHRDRDLQSLCDAWADMHPSDPSAGYAAFGMYWCLVELLGECKEHCFKVNTARGMANLVRELSAVASVDEGEVRLFLDCMHTCCLLDRGAYEHGTVTIERLLRNVEEFATRAAAKQKGARAGAKARWDKKQ